MLYVYAMTRIPLTEVAATAERLEEDVKSHGLDEDLYLAVMPAELGTAGRVNKNGRVYDVQEFVTQNQTLASRVSEQFVDGEAGHPSGTPTFDVPARLVSVTVETDGTTAQATGKFAILNTQVGRDILTLSRAGLAVGVSSRGYGVVTPHQVDEESPYWGANPDHRGESVDEVSEFELLTYDLVRVPSAGTHLKPATQEALEAFDRLSEAGFIEVSHKTEQEKTMARRKSVVETPEVVVDAENNAPVESVEIDSEKIIEEAREAAIEAVKGVDPLHGLSETQRDTLMRLASVIQVSEEDAPADDELVVAVHRVAEQADVDRGRLAESEETNRLLSSRIKALEEEIQAEQHKKTMAAAVAESVEGLAHSERVRGEVELMVSEGLVHTTEAIKFWAERLNGMLDGISVERREATGDAVIEAVDSADDIIEGEQEEAPASTKGPGFLDENFMDTLTAIIDRDRSIAGRV